MHTHPHLHTHMHIHPVTTDHGNTALKIFCQGLRAEVALALGPTFYKDPKRRGRRGLVLLDGSPQDLKLGKEGQKPWEVGRRRKSRAGQMLFTDL